jgi:hypothetical protein
LDQQQPQQSPQWGPPPQQSGWVQPNRASTGARPAGVTFAGVYLIVMGVLFLLFAALAFIGGAAFSGFFGAEMGGMFASLFAFFAIVLLLFAIGQLAGGIGSLQGKNWARVTGIVVSVLVVVFMLLSVPAALTGAADVSGLIITLALIAMYGFAAWALATAGSYFAYRR